MIPKLPKALWLFLCTIGMILHSVGKAETSRSKFKELQEEIYKANPQKVRDIFTKLQQDGLNSQESQTDLELVEIYLASQKAKSLVQSNKIMKRLASIPEGSMNEFWKFQIEILRAKNLMYQGKDSAAHAHLNRLLEQISQINSWPAVQLFRLRILFFNQTSLLSRAISELEALLPIVKSLGDQREVGKTILQLSVLLGEIGMLDKAMENGFEALSAFEQLGDFNEQVMILNNLATAQNQIGSKEKAVELFRKALQLFTNNVSFEYKCLTLGNLTFTLLNLNRLSEAIRYLDQLRTLVVQQPQSIYSTYIRLLSIILLNKQKKYREAISALEKVGETPQQLMLSQFRIWQSTQLGIGFEGLGKIQEAEKHYLKALEKAQKTKIKREIADALLQLHQYYLRDGRYKESLNYYTEYINHKSLIASQNNKNSLLALEIKLAKERQLRQGEQLRILERENEFKRAELSAQKHLEWIYLGIGFLLITGLFVLFFLLKKTSILKEKIRKYYHSEQALNRHFLSQLNKVFYPHQIKQIKQGRELEETMPTQPGEAVVLAFDIVRSSQIKSDQAQNLIEDIIKNCLAILDGNYNESKLSANGYRIKEMGDGFLCSIGYPFTPPTIDSLATTAVRVARQMIVVFYQTLNDYNIDQPVHCCIGIASGPIQGQYPKNGIKDYDLFGEAIIKATRYEEMRKFLFDEMDFSSLIVSHDLIAKVNPETSQEFQPVNLLDKNLVVRDDPNAEFLYYQILADVTNKAAS